MSNRVLTLTERIKHGAKALASPIKGTPTTEQSKAIVHRLQAKVLTDGNRNVVDELAAADYVIHGPEPEETRPQPSHADSTRHLLQTVLAGDVVLPSELCQLQSQLTGDVILPTDSRYDQLRTLWNDMIDKHPALIVRCMGTADVAAAVTFACKHDLPLSVCGGKHNIAGTAVCDNGLMIDLSQMNGIHVDP